MGLEFALCPMHSILLTTCRLDYETNASTLPSGGLGVAHGVHHRRGATSQVGGQENTTGGLPQPLRLFPALRVNRNILPHHTAAGVIFPLNIDMKLSFWVFLLFCTWFPFQGGLALRLTGFPFHSGRQIPPVQQAGRSLLIFQSASWNSVINLQTCCLPGSTFRDSNSPQAFNPFPS